MTINSAAILKLQELGDTKFTLLLPSGNPCRVITAEELRVLARAGHVQARILGTRLGPVKLLVPPGVAFREVVR